jgi:hypothetical protein
MSNQYAALILSYSATAPEVSLSFERGPDGDIFLPSDLLSSFYYLGFSRTRLSCSTVFCRG